MYKNARACNILFCPALPQQVKKISAEG